MTGSHGPSAPRRILLVAGLALAVGTAAAALRPEQFSVGWPLAVAEDRTIFDVPLTLEVYRNAASDEQIAVLDADGDPMSFYRVSSTPAAVEQRVPLAPSPLFATENPDAVAQLSVATAQRQTSVTVTQPDRAAESEVVAFVVDARAVAAAPFALDLDWRSLPQPFLIDVRVEQSTTLTDWRPVGRAAVAALAVGGAEVRHGRVPVVAAPGGYYRITWPRGSVADWYLERVTLVSSAAPRAASESVNLAPLADVALDKGARAPSNALYFDAGGAVPATSATINFTAASGWARADVAAAASLDGPWSAVAQAALFYELEYEGERLASEPLTLGRRTARYWRVTTSEPLAPERVALRLEYAAEVLRVAAEGTPPYLLAAGTLSPEAGPDPTFAAVWAALPAGTMPPRALLGPLRELGGAAALEPLREIPWRTVLLWTVLGAGVLAVAWMAVRLARELREPPS